jgi:hypothetical protein
MLLMQIVALSNVAMSLNRIAYQVGLRVDAHAGCDDAPRSFCWVNHGRGVSEA